MLGDIVYRLASALTPDKVKQMKAVGLGKLAETIVGELERIVAMVPRPIDSEVWIKVQARLIEIRDALREG